MKSFRQYFEVSWVEVGKQSSTKPNLVSRVVETVGCSKIQREATTQQDAAEGRGRERPATLYRAWPCIFFFSAGTLAVVDIGDFP